MNRYIPFGYKIENGEPLIHQEEAAVVCKIFEMYLGGTSFKKIAETLESRGIRYNPYSASWNKNMVKRIIENQRYVGEIIAITDFEQANILKTERNTFKPKPKEMQASVPVTEVFIYTPNLETTRLSKEIDRELDITGFDKEKIKNLILQCTATKYAACAGRN